MNFTEIPAHAAVFLDANVFVYHFGRHPTLAQPCTALLEKIENQEVEGYTSADVVSDMAHRLMAVEAAAHFGWPQQGIALRLKGHPTEVQQLTQYRQAIDELPLFRVQILPVTAQLVSLAADVSRQTGLLCSDALIVSTMRANGLTNLASNDADFDRVPGLTRYAPA
jgi:predicted nucleic acid-binding protein